MNKLLRTSILSLPLAITSVAPAKEVVNQKTHTVEKVFQWLDCTNPPKWNIRDTAVYQELYKIYQETKRASNLQTQIRFTLKWDCAIGAFYNPHNDHIIIHTNLIVALKLTKNEIRAVIAHELWHAHMKERGDKNIYNEEGADIYSHKLLSKMWYDDTGIINVRKKEKEYYRTVKYPSRHFLMKMITKTPEDYGKATDERIQSIRNGL